MINVSKACKKNNQKYQAITEISSIFDDFLKLEHVYNLLIEKMDKTVKIFDPIFFHSALRIESLT